MSFQRPSEAPSYDRFVSLNEYVLQQILRHLESAVNFLTEAELSAAVNNLNYAWTLCPAGVRNKIKESPAKIIRTRIKQEVPSIGEILKHNDWLETISEDRILSHCQEEGQYFDEEGVRANLYQEARISEILEEILFDLQLDVVKAMEASGLYISAGGSRIIPTADRTPETPLPLLQKLTPSQPR